jgi:hypothetical protein
VANDRLLQLWPLQMLTDVIYPQHVQSMQTNHLPTHARAPQSAVDLQQWLLQLIESSSTCSFKK